MLSWYPYLVVVFRVMGSCFAIWLSKTQTYAYTWTISLSDRIYDSNCASPSLLSQETVNMFIQEIIEILDVSGVLDKNSEACIDYNC